MQNPDRDDTGDISANEPAPPTKKPGEPVDPPTTIPVPPDTMTETPPLN